MRGGALVALALLAAVACQAPPLGAAESQPAAGTVTCAACGMRAEAAGRFSARLESGGATLYFCDIGDLVWYIARKRPEVFTAAVHDLSSGEWVDARAAAYVIDKKAYATPMGWGVAAFRDRAAAVAATGAALDFEALRAALR